MATGSTEFIDSTTADVFVPELWSDVAIPAREDALVYASKVDRRYEDNLTYGDTIHSPSISNLTAQTKTKAANTILSFQTVTETNTDISIATWEYVALAVESIVNVQANRKQLEMYAGKMGFALGLAVDDVLAGYPDNSTNSVGTLAAENPYTDWTRARQYLDDAKAPKSDRCWIISPAAETGLLDMEKYTSNDYSQIHGEGPATTGVEQAYSRSLLKIPAYVTTNVEGTNAAGHDNVLLQKEAFALVMQLKPKLHEQKDINYLVDKVVLEQIYGSAVMRNDHAVWVKGA